MATSYYPGCTLKTKARNLEVAALESASVLGLELVELPRWNCCGAVYSLADDNLLNLLAPVRVLIRALEQGNDKLVTICSMCYNTLARANRMMREDLEKRHTINGFMDEEPDYAGEIQVVHYLDFLRDELGWAELRKRVTNPLQGLKVAPYYGCTLTRPYEISLDPRPEAPTIMSDFLEALGATPTDFPHSTTCCGSYQVLADPQSALASAENVLGSAISSSADILALSCPLCEYNLGLRQRDLPTDIPTIFFSQLLAMALGLGADLCHFELNQVNTRKLLRERDFPLP